MFYDDPTMAHQNEGEVIRRIKERYFWPNLAKDVKEYVKTCYACQQSPIKKLDTFLIRFVYVFFSYKKRIIKRI